jgi:Atypical Arm repeat/Armadillo/beta-catenin-like repeat
VAPGAQVIINCGALPCLLNLLTTGHKKSIKKEACWTISNITAGTKEQIQAVIDATIVPPLVHLLATAEFDIKKEAAWAISNATSGGTSDQIKYLVSQGAVKPLCDLLTCSDVRIVTVALEGLENILKVRCAANRGCGLKAPWNLAGAWQRAFALRTGAPLPGFCSGCRWLGARLGSRGRLARAALLGATQVPSRRPSGSALRRAGDSGVARPAVDGGQGADAARPPRGAQIGEAEKDMAGPSGVNPYVALVDEAEGLDKIEDLQNHSHEDIYDKAVNILETFFDVEDGEVENLAPQVDVDQGTYTFGAPAAPGVPGLPQGGFNFQPMG